MKTLVKRAIRGCWKLTFPVRRPLMTRTEAFLRRCMNAGPSPSWDTTVVLDHVVRELVRLQRQVDELRQSVDRLAEPRDGFSVVSDRRAS